MAVSNPAFRRTTADWTFDNLADRIAEGYVWLFSVDGEGIGAHPAFRAAAEATGAEDPDEPFGEERGEAVAHLQAAGWITEEATHDGFDAVYIVGKPPTTYPALAFEPSGHDGYLARHACTLRELRAWGIIKGAADVGMASDEFDDELDGVDTWRLFVSGDLDLRGDPDGLTTPDGVATCNVQVEVYEMRSASLGGDGPMKPNWYPATEWADAPALVQEQAEKWATADA